ncbi:sigma-54-dependent transcriptional regulator [Candidatus Neomarinimicrobiota bacterium]
MTILVVDDERAQRESLAGFLRKIGHTVQTAASGDEALKLLIEMPMDVVLSDFRMPGMTGGQLLRKVRTRYPTTVIILLTAFGTIETAVNAMKAGAWDFLTKPVDLDLLEAHLEEITAYKKDTIDSMEDEIPSEGLLIAVDPQTHQLLDRAQRVAASQATILITGETGTGKEVLARWIHDRSTRKGQPFVAVNCAALPSNLVESELFGHEKGAFTGASSRRIGRFEEADRGTLFLDEIGDLPLDVQVKLLRFLEQGEFQRVGSNKALHSNTRLISATNTDLSAAVGRDDFREDLYFRLNVVHLRMPPLRERQDDIIPLAEHFVKSISQRESRQLIGCDEEAHEALLGYPFPGNVRELRNIIERAVLLSTKPVITAEDLELDSSPPTEVSRGKLTDAVANLERDLIARTLVESGNNQSECARRLGISERVLRYKLQKYSLR